MYSTWQKNFVFALEVDSPIVISVPHDGLGRNDFDDFFKNRSKLPNSVNGKDKRAWHVARHINRKEHFASMVRGLLPRRMVDYNRPSSGQEKRDHAFADEDLKDYFNFYHRTIGFFLDKAVKKYGRAVLVDVHGFLNQPSFGQFDVILGTDHKNTIKSDLDEKIAAQLTASGYRVFIPQEQEIEGEVFPGGYTVKSFASKKVDAIQIEVAKPYRLKDAEPRKQLTGFIRNALLIEEAGIRNGL